MLGGDTVRAGGPLSLSRHGARAGRGGAHGAARTAAQPGDRLCVTGTIGDAALGLALRRGERPAWAARLTPTSSTLSSTATCIPRPRLAVAAALGRHAKAAMDVSDGLAGDLAKMMRAGGTTAAVDVAAIPLSPAARAALAGDPDLIERVVTGGDDYEILCAVPEERLGPFLAEAASVGVAAAAIGTGGRRRGAAGLPRRGPRAPLRARLLQPFLGGMPAADRPGMQKGARIAARSGRQCVALPRKVWQ